jgi:hypothetical protein
MTIIFFKTNFDLTQILPGDFWAASIDVQQSWLVIDKSAQNGLVVVTTERAALFIFELACDKYPVKLFTRSEFVFF